MALLCMEKEVKKELAVKFNEQALLFVINHLADVLSP